MHVGEVCVCMGYRVFCNVLSGSGGGEEVVTCWL